MPQLLTINKTNRTSSTPIKIDESKLVAGSLLRTNSDVESSLLPDVAEIV